MNMQQYKCSEPGNEPSKGQYIYHPFFGWCAFNEAIGEDYLVGNGSYPAKEFYTIDIDSGTQPPEREIDWEDSYLMDWAMTDSHL